MPILETLTPNSPLSLQSMASISTCLTASARARHLPSKPPLSLPSRLSSRLLSPRLPAAPRLQTRPLAVRASVQLPAAIKPGGGVETDRLPAGVRKRAMEAVDSYGGRVTIGDVASRAGLKVNEAERALQAIAADTSGFLEVSDEGDVLYVFPRDYRSKLAAKSLRLKIEPLLDKLKMASEYLIRVSFGTALIVSILLVYTTILVLISSRSDDDNRGRRGGRSYNSSFTIFSSDLFWYWDPYYYRKRKTSAGGAMNFVESVFSFVFGDGDPNQGLEEERWKLIGQYIASNGGVVTAEELAPYLDVPPKEEDMVDESYILPVLLRFEGRPEVDDEGNILYRFPSLQRTASSNRVTRKEYVGKKWTDWVDGVQKYLEERSWSFSNIGASEKGMVIGLGALNLTGVIILGSMLRTYPTTPGGLISFVAEIFPLLQIYAAAFFAIPLVRWFLLRKTNNDIDRRNLARKERAQALELPDSSLRRKLMSARDMATRTVIGSDKIVYSTEIDLSDQDYDARDWDSRFKELERSD